MDLRITAETVDRERTRLNDHASTYASLINWIRKDLGERFEESVDPVTVDAVRGEIATVFGDQDLAINVTGLSVLLGELDVANDYPGFVVDELLGRRLAITIADGEPQATLAAATFHVIDAGHGVEGANAGIDDREAGVAAGLQVRLPGWEWQNASPFAGSIR